MICTLEITGAYPSLEVTDVHGLEVANGMSKAKLWHMLSIDKYAYALMHMPSVFSLFFYVLCTLNFITLCEGTVYKK